MIEQHDKLLAVASAAKERGLQFKRHPITGSEWWPSATAEFHLLDQGGAAVIRVAWRDLCDLTTEELVARTFSRGGEKA